MVVWFIHPAPLWATDQETVSAGLPAAVAFLQTHVSDSPEWAAMALAAAGQSAADIPISDSTDGVATDLARRILAGAAAGRHVDFLADQLAALIVNGRVGTDTYMNDDIFTILALRAAGRDPQTGPLHDLIQSITTVQRSDGGWGVTTLSRSDVDDTAAAVEAMVSAGAPTSIPTAIQFLHTQQNPDGGFPFRQGSTSNSASTAWAISAILADGGSMGEWRVGGSSPMDMLWTLQQPDGGFTWQPGGSTGMELLTSYAVIALSGKSLPLAVPPPPPPAIEPPPVPPPTPPSGPVQETPPATPAALPAEPAISAPRATIAPLDSSAPPIQSQAIQAEPRSSISRAHDSFPNTKQPSVDGHQHLHPRIFGAQARLPNTSSTWRDSIEFDVGWLLLIIGCLWLIRRHVD